MTSAIEARLDADKLIFVCETPGVVGDEQPAIPAAASTAAPIRRYWRRFTVTLFRSAWHPCDQQSRQPVALPIPEMLASG